MAGKTGSREGGGFWPPRATRFRTCTKGTQEVPSIFLVLMKTKLKLPSGLGGRGIFHGRDAGGED